MKNCKIIIKSQGDGWADNKRTKGTIFEKDGVYTLSYVLDGDDCRIKISPSKVIQTRQGELNITVEFIKNSKTQCQINSMGLAGGYSIFTKEIIFNCQRAGCSLTLNYLSGDDKEQIKLTLTAIYTENI
ncbi:MAG: DUF1934 domain-containing protein [Clostridiales bacterium]|nr:DUF1934 domain-containing protein [Clostridiales bacterium]